MITVIIPTYKPEHYLFECLLSLKSQDIKQFEIIIVLNGEKDPFYSKIAKWITDLNLSQCILIYTDKKGVSNARNIAIDVAKGRYISFIDDDDKISSNYLSGLIEKIDDSSVCLSNERTFNDSFLKKGTLAQKFDKLKNKKTSIVSSRSFFSTACFKMIPVNIIGTHRFNTNFVNGEDALFMALISDKIKSIRFAGEDVVYYRRIRENSASRRKRSFFLRLKNAINLFFAFGKIYFSSPLKYNILFFATRFVAVFKEIIQEYVNKWVNVRSILI
jgi:glycosyltransferase involved in cell wall biosynthesis